MSDDARGIDRPGSLGGSGVLQERLIAPMRMQLAAYALIAAGLACGLPSVLAAPRPMLVVGALTLFVAVMYSNRYFGLKYHALGDAAVFALCGPLLTFGASIAAFGHVLAGTSVLGAIFGLAAVGILHANNMQDIAIDRSAGAFTVASLLGSRASRWYFAALYALAVTAWASTHRPPLALAMGLLGFVPAAILLVRTLRARDLQAPRFRLLRVQAAQAHLAIGAGIFAALIASTLIGGSP